MRASEECGAAGPAATGAQAPVSPGDTRQGFATAIAAYLLWGLVLPFFMKALSHVSPVEIVAHRVLWALPAGALILLWLGRTADLKAALIKPRVVAMAAVTATVISLNWGIYVYAIVSNQALEASLGYYINPLISVVLGMVFLGEKPNRPQWVAIALAGLAVIILTVFAGRLPWISLVLALSFGTYGYLRKTLPIGPSQGFLLEVIILSPIAIALIGWYIAQGESHFLAGSAFDTIMLIAAGPVTAIPLVLYAFGAKGLRLSTIGVLQYLVPTLIFVIAVFVFGEPFALPQLIAFALIWLALIIYTWTLFAERRTLAAART
ncbi:EamA family transporter RarD [Pararhizobium haloflavum]|uniref:EamA family transporter RarD n=1 Tax=Pararhizobium haloflavum TaxID=2037914 RepID=UPI000C18CC98|nr:EamA family transporter RarD [Pararhizobium haloflavum]